MMVGWRTTGKPWDTHWVSLILDRNSGPFCHQIPQEEWVCPPRCTLGHCLHQALSGMCITLASIMYDQLKRCFALLISSNILITGKKIFQWSCTNILCFFWHTQAQPATLKLKKKSIIWNYIDLHIVHCDNANIWYLIWENTDDNHLYMGQLGEAVKAHALLTAGDCWDCKLRLSSSFWAGCVM